MPKPITDGAEVSIDFPDKAYFGMFGRGSGFAVEREEDGIALKLIRSGEDKRIAAFHLHFYLLADMISGIAKELTAEEALDEPHRAYLAEAVDELAEALKPRGAASGKGKARKKAAPGKRK